MSGVSLAAGQDEAKLSSTLGPRQKQQPQQQQAVGIMGSLRVIELQLVAFIMVLSASGLVPLFDLAYPAFLTSYMVITSRLAFPSHGGKSTGSPELFHGSKLFGAYVVFGSTVGLFLPLAYVLGGFARGDEHAVRLASPTLFLLSCQILTDNIIAGLSLFSPPVRALCPLLYTIRRIFVILDWTQDVWINKTLPANADIKDNAWHWFGRVLAVVNLLCNALNLFGFLIPCFLPRAFERYFQERDEIAAKTREDKRSAGFSAKDVHAEKAD